MILTVVIEQFWKILLEKGAQFVIFLDFNIYGFLFVESILDLSERPSMFTS